MGALDRKHVIIVKPKKSGSKFYNYLGSFSINLMAIVDADYKFVMVDVGAYGSNNDGGIFISSNIGQQVIFNKDLFPPPQNLPGTTTKINCSIIADAAFPLRNNIMKPFPSNDAANLCDQEYVYNYRLCRARRVVENAFGILAACFRSFHRTIGLSPQMTRHAVLATIVLHNFLTVPKDITYQETIGCNTWKPSTCKALQNMQKKGNCGSLEAILQRTTLMEYFMGPGAVAHQQRSCHIGTSLN